MATSVPHVQEALAEQLSGESDVVAAYLFGSLATGGASSDSDVDVAVLLRTPPSPARHLELIDLVQQTVGPRRADLVILNQAPLTLAYQVLRDGQVLTGAAHPDRLEHWVHTVDRYLDMAPLRRTMTRGLRHRLSEGRFG
jgi:predicted nucleotidyltransferase